VAFRPGDRVVVDVRLRANVPVEDPVVSIALTDDHHRFVFGTNTSWREVTWPRMEGEHRVRFSLTHLPFVSGRYHVTLGVHSRGAGVVYHSLEETLAFEVRRGIENTGPTYVPLEIETEPLHQGGVGGVARPGEGSDRPRPASEPPKEDVTVPRSGTDGG